MDNGHKIDIGKAEVKLFLKEEMLPSRMDAPDLYDLNTEYAKTRSKKMSFVTLVLLCCIAVVALITWGVVMFIEAENSNLEVDIAVFDDLNLKNLLDVVSKTQDKLDQNVKKKNQLNFELQNKINLAQLDRDADLQLIESLRMSVSERKIREQEVIAMFDKQVAELNQEYQPQISFLEAQNADLTKQISSYDSKNVELAKEQEAAINSQRQAFEIEKKQLTDDYESIIADLMLQIESMQKSQLAAQTTAIETLKAQQENELALLDPKFTDKKANQLVLNVIENILVEEAMTQAVEVLAETENVDTILTEDMTGKELTESQNEVIEESANPSAINEISTEEELEQQNSTLKTMYLPEVVLNLTDKEFQSYVEKSLYELDSQFADFNYVADMVATVPWMNSLKDYIVALTEMTNQIGTKMVLACIDFLQRYEEVVVKQNELVFEQQKTIERLEAQLAQKIREQEQVTLVLLAYEDVLDSLDERARKNGEAGYIITINDKNNLDLFISTRHRDSVKDGTKAYVFRESGNLIGTITIRKKGTMIYGVADDDIANKLRVNDSILLELN